MTRFVLLGAALCLLGAASVGAEPIHRLPNMPDRAVLHRFVWARNGSRPKRLPSMRQDGRRRDVVRERRNRRCRRRCYSGHHAGPDYDAVAPLSAPIAASEPLDCQKSCGLASSAGRTHGSSSAPKMRSLSLRWHSLRIRAR